MFKKINRISRPEFESYFLSGKRYHSPSFELRFIDHSKLKVAVVVSKKHIRSSVIRNRIRRQLYHILKQSLRGETGVFIVIVKRGINQEVSTKEKQELIELVGRIRKPR